MNSPKISRPSFSVGLRDPGEGGSQEKVARAGGAKKARSLNNSYPKYKYKNNLTKNKNKNKLTPLNIASWNIKTLLDSSQEEYITIPRRSAIIARELKHYRIDIVALQETHLKGTGQMEEKCSGYTYMWSGCEDDQPNYYRVAICARTELVKKQMVSEPVCHSDRIMSVQIKGKDQETTFVCVYAPTLNAETSIIESFYEDLNKIIDKIPKTHGLIIAGDLNARVGNTNLQWEKSWGNMELER